MSKTPKFDGKLDEILAATQPGARQDPVTDETWTLTRDELARCRYWRVPPSPYAPLTRMKL